MTAKKRHINQHAAEYGTAFARIGHSDNWESGPLGIREAARLVDQLRADGHQARGLYPPYAGFGIVTVEGEP